MRIAGIIKSQLRNDKPCLPGGIGNEDGIKINNSLGFLINFILFIFNIFNNFVFIIGNLYDRFSKIFRNFMVKTHQFLNGTSKIGIRRIV